MRSLEPLPRARRTPASRSTSPTSSADRLRRAQAAGVHQLEQRAVAQRARVGAARRGEQPRDLAAAQDLRQLLVLARRAQVGGRVVVELALAAQVAVERAQARGLALQRRGRDRRALLAARRELAQEAGEVGVLGGQDVGAAAAAGTRRTAAGPSGRPRACCATARARTRGRRGSRARGARTTAAPRRGRRPWCGVRRRRPTRPRRCNGACALQAPLRRAGRSASARATGLVSRRRTWR